MGGTSPSSLREPPGVIVGSDPAYLPLNRIVATGPFVLVFYLCRGFFDQAPDLATSGAFIYSLVLAFLIGFLTESLIGMLSFWFLENESENEEKTKRE